MNLKEMFDNSENHKDRKEIWREIVTTPQEETSQEFLPNTANTPSIPKVEEWEKELELGGDIFDLEGEVRPDGKEVLKELIEHLLTKERERITDIAWEYCIKASREEMGSKDDLKSLIK